MKFRTKLRILALVCGADVLLGLGLVYTVRDRAPAHVAADSGTGVWEGGDTLDRARGLEGKCVALTFDDGPHDECTPMLLDGLKKRGVRVTFFLMGQSIEGNEEIVKRMKEEGHLVGNHSYSHIQLTKAGAGAACEGVDKTSRLIENITGEPPQYMRPPFGDWNEELECRVGMTTVLWSVDSLDWKLKNKNRIVKRVLKDVEDGDIILMHDIFPTSVEAALEIVDALTKEGYTFVTVDELLID
ncbi:MAG: polysaccharide deacetylase family protein [Clostridium sp.]|nr:polysaccharide deacetylase family protein [Clostridium sp.]